VLIKIPKSIPIFYSYDKPSSSGYKLPGTIILHILWGQEASARAAKARRRKKWMEKSLLPILLMLGARQADHKSDKIWT
jgi:hypothetical protein